MAKNCVFCEIVRGNIKSYKVYEDKNYLAILDVFQNIKGQTLVLPKRHLQSYAFALSDRELSGIVKASKRVARLLEKGLDTSRVHMVFEGLGVAHLHAKLYPAIGVKSKRFKQVKAKTKVRFKHYTGYVTTLMGPRANEKELKRVQKRIAR